MLSRLKSVVKRALGRETPPPPAPSSRPTPPPAVASPRPPAPTNGSVAAKPEAPKAPVAAVQPPPAKVEPPKAEPVKAEAPKAEPAKVEAPKAEPAKAEAPKAEAPKAEAAKPTKGSKKDGKTEPKAEPAKAEAPKAEPVKAEAPKAEPVKAEAPKAEPKKLSLAERAAAAARAPVPAPAAVSHADDDDHADEPVAKKATTAGHGDSKAAPKHLHADTGSTDKESYILRAKANGRDVSLIMGDEGMNTSPDGTKFWGPLLNESSKAKAAGKVLTIDQNECISCGTCVEQTEHVFYLPADGKAAPIAQDGPMDLIEDAIEACPVTCIQWLEKEEAEEKGFATGMGDEA